MKSRGSGTALMVISALLWLVIIILGGTGHWLAALFALLGLLLAYALAGSARDGRLDLRLVAFPTLVWLAMWAIAFWLAERQVSASADATLLGFHRSFVWIILLYWLGASAVMAFGFALVKDRWLPEERWAAFLRRVHHAPTQAADEQESAR